MYINKKSVDSLNLKILIINIPFESDGYVSKMIFTKEDRLTTFISFITLGDDDDDAMTVK